VEKLLFIIYKEASAARFNEGQIENKKQSTFNVFDSIRQGLAHPFPTAAIHCVVASVNGLDSASTHDRAMVASRLWTAGIAAEYLPQSGTFTSLLRYYERNTNKLGALFSVSSFDFFSGTQFSLWFQPQFLTTIPSSVN
jgi:hypothetical protein